MSGRYRQQDFILGQSLLCRWDYVQGAQATPTLVLPDACVDLLWDGARLSIAGPDTRAQYARVAPGRRLQGLRFAPAAAMHWLGIRCTRSPTSGRSCAIWAFPAWRR